MKSLWLLSTIITLLNVVPGLAATTLTYDYDANGNMIRGEGKYYEYNDANQLVKIRQNNAIGAIIAEYSYDYNGQRIKKVENGVTTYYIGKHFEKQLAGNSQSSTDYYFANGERVAKKESSGRLTYFHSDQLGGTNATTDAAGNLVERTKYYPFGEMREGGSEKYSYTGKEKDKQTDWYYYEARYYNPQTKHFTQSDLIPPDVYKPQSFNRYSYGYSNPIKYGDPTGKTPVISVVGAIAGISIIVADIVAPFYLAAQETKVDNIEVRQLENWLLVANNKSDKIDEIQGGGNIPTDQIQGLFKKADILNANLEARKILKEEGIDGVRKRTQELRNNNYDKTKFVDGLTQIQYNNMRSNKNKDYCPASYEEYLKQTSKRQEIRQK